MNVTLVAIHTCRSPQAVPLACAFLQEALLADPAVAGQLRVSIVESFLDDSPAACAEAILKTAPDLVAFSVYVWGREHAVSVAQRLARIAPGVPLCAGGAEPSTNPAGLLESGLFRFLILGEGETPLLQVVKLALEGKGPEGVPGVLTPGGSPCPLPPPVDVDSIPSPYLSGRLDPAAAGGALWQLSRGCDFACAFCFDHKGKGGVRRVGMQRIEAELRLFARLNVPQVFVLDSTFNKIPARAKEILRLIKRLAPRVHFHFEVRSEFIDPEMAELFASITCSLQIGLQSSDPAVLRAVGRGFDPGDFSYRVSLLNNSGAVFGFDLIYGLPGDTLATFRRSLDFALSLYPNHLDIFPLAVLPGTRLHAKSESLAVKHLEAPPYTILSSPGFPAADLEKARQIANACDIFYSRGKAVAWFNAVAHAVKLSPSSFLEAFARFLGARGARDEQEVAEQEIPEMQRAFITGLFREKKKARLLPLALDLVEYHHHYAAALMATPPAVPHPRELKKMNLMSRALMLSPSASLARFNYEILEILEAGDMELAQFASCFKPSECYAVIYPAEGEVRTESVSKEYFDLLLALDGKDSAGSICSKLSFQRSEAAEFFEFALMEGIVTLSDTP